MGILAPVVSSPSVFPSALWKPQQCQKGIMRFAVPLQHGSRNLYPVFLRTAAPAVRCISTKGSVELHNACNSSSGGMAPEDMQRSKMLLDNSSTSMDNTNDFETELQEFFNQVKSMLVSGNKEGAIDLLRANYSLVKEQIDAGTRGMEQAATLDIIALGYMGVGDLKFVENLLEMLHEMVGCVQNDEPLLDSILMHMGSMYTTLGRLEDAMLVYNRGLEILEGLFGKHSPFLITPLMGIARVFGLTGRATKAIEIYHQAISILEISRGNECEDLVVPLCALGNLFMKEGRITDAESSFKRILNIYTSSYGANDGRAGMAMCSLAHAMCAKGNINDAILLYRKGLEVIKDSEYMSLDDDVLERMRVDFAELLHVSGREQEGRELLEECLLICERYKGKEHPSSVTHLLNLASSYSRSKNFVEAERLLRTSLQIMSKVVAPEDQSLTVPMLHLAITLYHLKRDEEAERLALEAVHIRENAFGKQSLPVGEALDCLISIQASMGKADGDLMALLKRVLSIQEESLGYESEEVMVTLTKILSILDKLGRQHEKLPLQKRLSVLRRRYKQRVPI